jgi:hypothetical protein
VEQIAANLAVDIEAVRKVAETSVNETPSDSEGTGNGQQGTGKTHV